jgi:hypothetical protein
MTFLDRLAEIEHRQWMQWAKTILDTEPGISLDRRARWEKMMVPFAELSEEWKEYDREWARHVYREVMLQLDEDHVAYFGHVEKGDADDPK